LPSSSGRSRYAALAVLALAVAAAWWALRLSGPPEVLPATAPAGEFSADRAFDVVDRLARRPRPLGAAAHGEVAAYLTAELERLGLEVAPQTTVAVSAHGRQVVAAEVHNVVGRLRGTAPGRAVLLMAHYDSRPNTPGAGDDAAGVAAIVETLRVLAAGPPLRNDLIVLFSDAEEIGLLGAQAFADEHEWMPDVAAVLNFEGRGNGGPAMMFETGPGSAALVRAMGAVAPAPLGSSLMNEVYKRMPNDTDFTVFKERGVAGLNFAFLRNLTAYHSPLDTAAALDRRSLQHHGSNALALARWMGEADLSAPPAPETVYFNPVGHWLLVYPAAWVRVLALATTALLLAVLVVGRRRQRLTWSAVRGGMAIWTGILVLAPAAVWTSWNLFTRLAPELLDAPNGVPYAAGLLALATCGIILAVVVALSASDDRDSMEAQAGGILLGWAILVLATAFLAPGASYLFLWPLVGGVAALAAIIGRPEASTRSFMVASLGTAALIGVVILTPTVDLLFDALTLHAGWVVALFVGLLLSLLAPVLGVATEGRAMASAIWITVAAIGLSAAVVWKSPTDVQHPRTASLFYVMDTDESVGRWMSLDETVGAATAEWLGAAPTRDSAPRFLIPVDSDRQVWSTIAAAVDLPAPTVRLVDDQWEDGVRRLTLRVASQRQAEALWLEAGALVAIEGLSVAGQVVEMEEPSDVVRLIFFGPPADGFEITFEMTDRQPVELHLADQSYGLPAEAGVERSWPPGVISDPGWSAWSTFVSRRTWN